MNEEIGAENLIQGHNEGRHNSATYDLFILVLTIFSLVVVMGLFIGPVNRASSAIFLRVDFVICVVFFSDFLLNLWRAPGKADYFFKEGGWLDLLGAIPAVHGLPWPVLLRLARLNRLVRIVKHLQGKDRDEVVEEARDKPAQTALLSIIFTALILITLASLLIVPLERGAEGAEITSGPNAFWWAFVTVTTVGYGDYTPINFPGRVLAMILMTFGIGIFAVLTSFAAAKLVVLHNDEEDMVAIVRTQNTILRAELAEIKEMVKQQGSMEE